MAFAYYPEAEQDQLYQNLQQQQPQQPAKPRWSAQLESNPYGAYGEQRKAWFDDPNSDPNAKVQQELAGYRQQWGAAAPADDASLMQMIASGQTPAPKNATPAQQWNAQPSQTSARSDDLYALLMGRAKQGTAVDRNDPNVRAQVDPFRANVERQKRSYLSDVAEAQGPYANIRGEQRMAAERAGQQSGLFEAQVIGGEIDARRQEISQALSLWGQMLSGDQRLALERELAMLNDRARTADRSQQNDQFLRELALREWMAGDDSDYRWSLGGL